jgi:MoaA/NifB/PqqE/SkfB family radical SAM enzyme
MEQIDKLRIFEPASKVLANYDKVDQLLSGGNPSPVLVEVDPSNACNHGCVFCSSSYIHFPESKKLDTFDRSVLPLDLMLKTFNEFDSMGIRAVTFTGGGDPTVNPKLKNIIEHAGKNTNLKMGLYSNGVLFEKFDLYESIVKYITWVRVGVDAGNAEDYATIRQIKPNEWQMMLDNVQKLIETKKRLNSDITLGVGFVITESTVDQVIGFAETFADFDLDYCQYKTDCVNLQRWEEGYTRDFSLFDKIKDDLLVAENILGSKFHCKIEGMEDVLKGAEHLNHYEKCLGSQLQPCLGADGHVYVCPQLRGYKEYSYGSLYEKGFKEIWDDIGIRKSKMNKIENVECFSNCTQLCKPHLSNKKIWDMHNNFTDENRIELRSQMQDYRDNISHWEFI